MLAKMPFMMNYKFGDIVLVNSPTTGSNLSKKRPAVVVLDIGDADIVLAPITTKAKLDCGDYKLKDRQQGGLLRESWIRLAKVTCLEKCDITRHLGILTKHDLERVEKVWNALYSFS